MAIEVLTVGSEKALEFVLNNNPEIQDLKVLAKGAKFTLIGNFIPPDNQVLNSPLAGGDPPPSWAEIFAPGVYTLDPDPDYPGGFLLDFDSFTGRYGYRQLIDLPAGIYTASIFCNKKGDSSGRSARIQENGATISITRDFRLPSALALGETRDYCVFEVLTPGQVRFDFGAGLTSDALADYTLGRPMLITGDRPFQPYNPSA